MYEDWSDDEAIEDIKNNNGQIGLRVIDAKYCKKIAYFLGVKYKLSKEDKEEIRQEVLIKLYNAVQEQRYDHIDNLEALLTTMSYRVFVDWLRKEKKQTGLLEALAKSDIADERNFKKRLETQLCIAKAYIRFQQEHPDAKDLLTALTLLAEGRSYKEISEAIGRTEQATRQFFSSQRRKLEPYFHTCRELFENDTTA